MLIDPLSAVRALAAPCIGCGAPTHDYLATWTPTAEVRRQLRDSTPDPIVYPLCLPCGRRAASSPAYTEVIEDRLIDRHRRRPAGRNRRRRPAPRPRP